MKKILPLIYIAGFLFILLLFTQFKADIPVEELKKKYTDERSRFIEIDGMQVHYRIEGSGFPLVLIHGTSSSLHAWEKWNEALKNDFTIVGLDLPAFGLTGPNAENNYTIDYYVSFLDEFLSKLNIDSFYLAGISLGGNIVWNYAAHHPEKVKKLILIDASGYPRDKMPRLFRIARMPVVSSVLKNFTPRYLVEKNMKELFYDDSKITDEMITRAHELALREGNRDAFLARVKNLYSTDHEKVKTIKTPTLIMWGREDYWIPLQDAYRFKEDIENSELKIYDNVGHIPNEEAAQLSAEDARAFLLKQ
jgi:pimeloyl-ACP methyl ester carboxylesterase